jgi:hypothetical protein
VKTVSTSYMDAWRKKHGQVVVLLVKYSRRYWDEASGTFKYETNADGTQRWTQLTIRDVAKVGQITWKLDTPLLNTVRASNVTLTLRNEDYQWVEQNQTSGVFMPDGFSVSKQPALPTRGYDPYLTAFQVLLAYQYSDGSSEPLPLFTGVAVDYRHDTDHAYSEVTVSGNEWLLQSADAQLVSQTFTNEAVTPAADGSNKSFVTSSTGVAYINSSTGIQVNGVYQVQGQDYTLSNVGQYGTPVTITFTLAPPAAATILVSGRKWYTLQSLDTLLTMLLAQAGITSYTVSPIVFPNATLSQLFINTSAQWQASTLSGVTATAVPGSIQAGSGLTSNYTNQGFETGDFTAWQQTQSGGGSLQVTNSRSYGGVYSALLAAFANLGTSKTRRVYLEKLGGGGVVQVDLASVTPGVWTQYTMAIPNDGQTYQLKAEVSIDSNLARITNIGQALYGGGGTVTFWAMAVNPISTGVLIQLFVDDFVVNAGTAFKGTALSAEIDLGAAPASWSQVGLVSADLNVAGSVSWSTQGSTTSGGTYSSLTAATGNIPQSPLRRFLKIQTELNGIVDGGGFVWNVPSVSSIRLQYFATSIVLAMADFSGQTVYDAIQQMAQLCDYEWGFTSTGAFFFRPKSVSATPVATFDQSDVIQKLSDFRPGYDAIINDGQVSYNAYYSEYNSGNLPEAAPTSQQRFLSQIRSESWSLLLAYDPNIAGGRAQVLHDNNYRPRRRCRIIGKIMPFLDLSDVVSFSFLESPAAARAWFGDPLQPWGAKTTAFGQPGNVLARDMVVKVVGMSLDPQNLVGEYDVQEVLS